MLKHSQSSVMILRGFVTTSKPLTTQSFDPLMKTFISAALKSIYSDQKDLVHCQLTYRYLYLCREDVLTCHVTCHVLNHTCVCVFSVMNKKREQEMLSGYLIYWITNTFQSIFLISCQKTVSVFVFSLHVFAPLLLGYSDLYYPTLQGMKYDTQFGLNCHRNIWHYSIDLSL